jgi:hypothetical protein
VEKAELVEEIQLLRRRERELQPTVNRSADLAEEVQSVIDVIAPNDIERFKGLAGAHAAA